MAAVLAGGCNGTKVDGPAPPAPQKVKYVVPVEDEVLEYEEFTGRTAAVEVVELRARVTGYLDKIAFEDGAYVKEGDLLMVIDPRTYVAEEARAKAAVDQYEARVKRLERQEARSRELFQKKAISQDEYETIIYDHNEAKAALAAAIATHDLAKLNVEFTRIKAPLSGKISRRLVDIGNLVSANTTPLATIVPTDELHVYFDVDERTVLRLRRLMQEGKIETQGMSKVNVEIALADRDEFGLKGVVDFEDNQVDPSTGTLRVRATVKNEHGLLSPGLFVRVRYPIGKPAPELLIPEESLGSDQGRPFVYVIGDENKVAYRSIEIGPLVGTKRVVRSGLEKGERIVVTGLQRIRRDLEVDPEPLTPEVESLAASAADEAKSKPAESTAADADPPKLPMVTKAEPTGAAE